VVVIVAVDCPKGSVLKLLVGLRVCHMRRDATCWSCWLIVRVDYVFASWQGVAIATWLAEGVGGGCCESAGCCHCDVMCTDWVTSLPVVCAGRPVEWRVANG
jgi:hypothetical protein